MNNMLLKVMIILLLIFVSFFVNLAKSAITVINDSSVAKRADSGDKKAKKLLKLIESPTAYTAAVSGLITYTHLFASALLSLSFTKWVAQKFTYRFDLIACYKPILIGSVILFTLILAYLFMIFGKIIPEKIGAVKCNRLAYSMCGFMRLITAVMRPFNVVAVATANGIMRLFGVDPHADEEEVTEEEIMMMVDAGKEKGVIEQAQRSMINNIFEFDDMAVSEIMTHRTEIVAVDINQSIADIISLAMDEGCSRIPVYEEDLDNIKGIVYMKDLLKFVGKKLPNGTLADVMRNVYYVPESKNCADLFTEMTEKHLQMCVVADEYGGTAGIVTMEDLLEIIVGNMQDEYDDEEEEVTVINETTFTIDGTTSIGDAEELLAVRLPEGEYDTVGGMIMSEIGRIPGEDEHPEIQINNCTFKVLNIRDRRIDKVLVEKKPADVSEKDN